MGEEPRLREIERSPRDSAPLLARRAEHRAGSFLRTLATADRPEREATGYRARCRLPCHGQPVRSCPRRRPVSTMDPRSKPSLASNQIDWWCGKSPYSDELETELWRSGGAVTPAPHHDHVRMKSQLRELNVTTEWHPTQEGIAGAWISLAAGFFRSLIGAGSPGSISPPRDDC